MHTRMLTQTRTRIWAGRRNVGGKGYDTYSLMLLANNGDDKSISKPSSWRKKTWLGADSKLCC